MTTLARLVSPSGTIAVTVNAYPDSHDHTVTTEMLEMARSFTGSAIGAEPEEIDSIRAAFITPAPDRDDMLHVRSYDYTHLTHDEGLVLAYDILNTVIAQRQKQGE